MTFAALLRGSFVAVLLPTMAWAADPLPAPTEEVVLTVTGAIEAKTAEDRAELDLAGLEAMGTVTLQTSTIWTDGTITFRGVPLKTFLDRLGAKGSTLHITALNDYSVDVPVSDAVAEGGPILAFEANGKPLSVRDKGPIWLIYPYDSEAAFRTEVIYSRSIWQIARIEVLD